MELSAPQLMLPDFKSSTVKPMKVKLARYEREAIARIAS
jgi:hypothetical protein